MFFDAGIHHYRGGIFRHYLYISEGWAVGRRLFGSEIKQLQILKLIIRSMIDERSSDWNSCRNLNQQPYQKMKMQLD
jgi:hypothetical protein